MLSEVLEGSALQFHQSLADNGLVGTVTALDVHHLGDGHTAGNPLFSGSLQVGHLGQVAGVTVLDQHSCVVTQGVAVVSIEVGGESAAAFVAQEVMQSTELADIGTGSLTGSQVLLDHCGEQLLGLDQRNLNVTMGVTLQEQLLLNVLGQDGEDTEGSLGQAILDEVVLGSPGGEVVESISLGTGQQLVDLSDQNGELGNELDNALGDDGNAEVPALRTSIGNINR